MDSNLLLVLVVDGGLVLFFLYALWIVSKLDFTKKEYRISDKSDKEKPNVIKVKDYEPTYASTAVQAEKVDSEEKPMISRSEEGIKRESRIEETEVIFSDSDTLQVEEAEVSSSMQDNESREMDPVVIDIENRINGIDILDVEGIGPAYKTRLNNIGIETVGGLLKEGSTPGGRKVIADDTGISSKLILEWVNICDLFRIKGVGEEYSDLLEEAGVDTVPELARRNPENLHLKLAEINTEKNLVRRLPSVSEVERWVESAKTLPRKIEY